MPFGTGLGVAVGNGRFAASKEKHLTCVTTQCIREKKQILRVQGGVGGPATALTHVRWVQGLCYVCKTCTARANSSMQCPVTAGRTSA